jgi:flagellar biosynthesis activator protein FlaF
VQTNALKAYQTVQQATMSGRETEARVLTKAALKLNNCLKHWDAADHRTRLDEALRYNQRVWSIFQTEVTNPENPLPAAIKQNIMQLGRFIDQRIFDTMAFPSPEKLKIVIRINENIAAGLRGSPVGSID